jgi:nitroreductase/NAD-dependent dihydropyrimidine dehydrogenase PreA subunit
MKTVTISDQCIQCGSCVKACPANVFTLIKKGDTPDVSHPEACIACGHCEAVCEPDAVISLTFREKGNTIPLQDNMTSLLASLRSVRNYSSKPLSQDTLEEIIQAGYNAPTAQNLRPVKIEHYTGTDIESMIPVVNMHLEGLTKLGNPILLSLIKLFSPAKGQYMADTVKKLKRITAAIRSGSYHFFHHAPHIIVLHAPKGNSLAKDDCDAALNHMRVAAHAKGLGSCIIGFAMRANKQLEKHLDLPKGNTIYGIITLGKPSIKYFKGIDRFA